MYLGLVYFPRIIHKGFHTFRKEYDPYSELLPEHVSFIYPVPETIGKEKIVSHIKNVLEAWEPFDVHFCTIVKSKDHWLFLGAKEGKSKVNLLHDDLYTGILAPYLRKDLPYSPRIGLGLFSIEKYDYNNPTEELTLDNARYNQAKKEFENLKFDFWCTINQLTLLRINNNLTSFSEIGSFKIH